MCVVCLCAQVSLRLYRYAPHNDVSVNDGPQIRRWSRKIIILYYNTYHCVTIAYSISTVTYCTGLYPTSNRRVWYAIPYYLGLCNYMFAQRRNRLTTHFSKRIPVDTRRISVLYFLWPSSLCIPAY